VCNCEQGVKEDFDWAAYLLEGEDIVLRHYVDSPVCKYCHCEYIDVVME